MNEKGIIMSGNHPRLILEGKKTQTRRVLKMQPLDVLPMKVPNEWIGLMSRNPNKGCVFKCRYGQVGDRLWVKETHIFEVNMDYPKDPRGYYNAEEEEYLIPHYKADGEDIRDWLDLETGEYGAKWRSSIHMPRWASRALLEITTRLEVLRAPAQTADDYNPRWAKIAPRWSPKTILPDDLIWHWDWDFRMIT